LRVLDEGVGVIEGRVNLGVVWRGDRAVMVDSGLDRDSARKALRVLEGEGLQLVAVVNTHSHADHFGGNSYLVGRTGAEVWAPRLEAAIIQNPLLEPIYLFHGANPVKALRNRFVLAKPSPVHKVFDGGPLGLEGFGLEAVPLPGHSFNHTGIKVGDVLFCGDAVFSRRVVEKYKIPVVQDVGAHLKSLEKLCKMDVRLFVPSHAKPVEDIKPLARFNLKTTERIAGDVLALVEEPRTVEEVHSLLATRYGLDTQVAQQWFLLHTTFMAYLGYLEESGRVRIQLEGNQLKWVASQHAD